MCQGIWLKDFPSYTTHKFNNWYYFELFLSKPVLYRTKNKNKFLSFIVNCPCSYIDVFELMAILSRFGSGVLSRHKILRLYRRAEMITLLSYFSTGLLSRLNILDYPGIESSFPMAIPEYWADRHPFPVQ